MIDTDNITLDGVVAGAFIMIVIAALSALGYGIVYSIAQEACK